MKISRRDAVTQAIDATVFEGKMSLQEWLAGYELWAIETALKRFSNMDQAAQALGMTRRQFSYRLRQGDTGWIEDGKDEERNVTKSKED